MCSGSEAGSYVRLIDCVNHSTLGVGVIKKRKNNLIGKGSFLPSTSHLKLILHQVFLTPFCRSELPHESVNLSFTITHIKNKSTDLCGN